MAVDLRPAVPDGEQVARRERGHGAVRLGICNTHRTMPSDSILQQCHISRVLNQMMTNAQHDGWQNLARRALTCRSAAEAEDGRWEQRHVLVNHVHVEQLARLAESGDRWQPPRRDGIVLSYV